MRTKRETGRDSIGTFIRQWSKERPDLDPSPLGVLGRVQRVSVQLQKRASEEWLGPLGLTWESFSLLMALRRCGAPFRLRPTDIYRESLLTSGAITNRIDRVENEGWVRRIPDPQDRRGTLVELTPAGRALADRAIALHFKKLDEIFSVLSKTESRTLASLLSKLLADIEQGASHKLRKSPVIRQASDSEKPTNALKSEF